MASRLNGVMIEGDAGSRRGQRGVKKKEKAEENRERGRGKGLQTMTGTLLSDPGPLQRPPRPPDGGHCTVTMKR